MSGVITQWRVRDAEALPLHLRVVRLLTGSTFSFIRSSDTGTGGGGVKQFDTRLQVAAGDGIGIDCTGNPAIAARTGVAGATYVVFGGIPADGDTPTGSPDASGIEHLFNATMEADVDNDVYGDETQDGCPQQTATHAACATAFTATAKRRKRSVEVTATIPGGGTVSVGDARDESLTASVAKKRKPRFKKASVSRSTTTTGAVALTVKLTKAGKARLKSEGELKARIKIVYAPSAGVSGSETVKVKLKK
jgi:hypothetical protein